eukprot:scaffold9824_cov200-Ochromonas_danica.AAC.3
MTANSTAAGGGGEPYHHRHPHHRVSSAVVASSVRPNAAITGKIGTQCKRHFTQCKRQKSSRNVTTLQSTM